MTPHSLPSVPAAAVPSATYRLLVFHGFRFAGARAAASSRLGNPNDVGFGCFLHAQERST